MKFGLLENLKFIISVLVCIACVWCSVHFFTSAEVASSYEEVKRLEESARFFFADGNNGVADIIVDRNTGVCYLWKSGSYKAGLTVLVDSSGNPVIWEE